MAPPTARASAAPETPATPSLGNSGASPLPDGGAGSGAHHGAVPFQQRNCVCQSLGPDSPGAISAARASQVRVLPRFCRHVLVTCPGGMQRTSKEVSMVCVCLCLAHTLFLRSALARRVKQKHCAAHARFDLGRRARGKPRQGALGPCSHRMCVCVCAESTMSAYLDANAAPC